MKNGRLQSSKTKVNEIGYLYLDFSTQVHFPSGGYLRIEVPEGFLSTENAWCQPLSGFIVTAANNCFRQDNTIITQNMYQNKDNV